MEGSQHKWTTNHGSVQCERYSGPYHAMQPGGFNADKDIKKKSFDRNSGVF